MKFKCDKDYLNFDKDIVGIEFLFPSKDYLYDGKFITSKYNESQNNIKRLIDIRKLPRFMQVSALITIAILTEHIIPYDLDDKSKKVYKYIIDNNIKLLIENKIAICNSLANNIKTLINEFEYVQDFEMSSYRNKIANIYFNYWALYFLIYEPTQIKLLFSKSNLQMYEKLKKEATHIDLDIIIELYNKLKYCNIYIEEKNKPIREGLVDIIKNLLFEF